MRSTLATRPAAPPTPDDGLGEPADVARGSRRERIRAKPGVGHVYRIGVFIAACCASRSAWRSWCCPAR
jgi:hypothetical protein